MGMASNDCCAVEAVLRHEHFSMFIGVDTLKDVGEMRR